MFASNVSKHGSKLAASSCRHHSISWPSCCYCCRCFDFEWEVYHERLQVAFVLVLALLLVLIVVLVLDLHKLPREVRCKEREMLQFSRNFSHLLHCLVGKKERHKQSKANDRTHALLACLTYKRKAVSLLMRSLWTQQVNPSLKFTLGCIVWPLIAVNVLPSASTSFSTSSVFTKLTLTFALASLESELKESKSTQTERRRIATKSWRLIIQY